nr:MAG TPA: hypothetical protein [Caudoviricetes sp.]
MIDLLMIHISLFIFLYDNKCNIFTFHILLNLRDLERGKLTDLQLAGIIFLNHADVLIIHQIRNNRLLCYFFYVHAHILHFDATSSVFVLHDRSTHDFPPCFTISIALSSPLWYKSSYSVSKQGHISSTYLSKSAYESSFSSSSCFKTLSTLYAVGSASIILQNRWYSSGLKVYSLTRSFKLISSINLLIINHILTYFLGNLDGVLIRLANRDRNSTSVIYSYLCYVPPIDQLHTLFQIFTHLFVCLVNCKLNVVLCSFLPFFCPLPYPCTIAVTHCNCLFFRLIIVNRIIKKYNILAISACSFICHHFTPFLLLSIMFLHNLQQALNLGIHNRCRLFCHTVVFLFKILRQILHIISKLFQCRFIF